MARSDMPLVPAYSLVVVGVIGAIVLAIAGKAGVAPVFLLLAATGVVVIAIGRSTGRWR